MAKPRYKATNWKHYNQALINRVSLTCWIDEDAIQHLAIDATGLKVYGEGEWKVKKHGTDGKRH
ncbi:hypothetical protein VIBRN418_14831 [Vibrio sp. N418]|nr:hypothetical protein VIBRN418_14831 [Vibrio sp. N418]